MLTCGFGGEMVVVVCLGIMLVCGGGLKVLVLLVSSEFWYSAGCNGLCVLGVWFEF